LEINGSKLDHIWETTEDDAGVRRFTANALEEAPSGTGGDATAASQTAIIGHLTGMKGGTWLETTDSLEAIRNRGDVAWTTGAGGSSPTVEEIRTEMDTNSTKMAPSQVLADYKATGFATINPPSSTLADYMADVSALALATVCTEARLARLDAAISSRSSHGDPDPSGFIDVAISSRNDTTPPTTDAIKTKIEEVGSSMAGVKAKTDNLKDSWNDPTAEACKADVSAVATSVEVAALNDITVVEILAGIIEGTLSLADVQRIILSKTVNKASGGETGQHKYRDLADTKDRVVETVDENGNRSFIILDGE